MHVLNYPSARRSRIFEFQNLPASGKVSTNQIVLFATHKIVIGLAKIIDISEHVLIFTATTPNFTTKKRARVVEGFLPGMKTAWDSRSIKKSIEFRYLDFLLNEDVSLIFCTIFLRFPFLDALEILFSMSEISQQLFLIFNIILYKQKLVILNKFSKTIIQFFQIYTDRVF